MRSAFLLLIVLFILSGCAHGVEAPEPDDAVASEAVDAATSDTPSLPVALAGTQWQLVEFRSMDDSTEQPQDTARYTMNLGADGTVAMQLNCNRGTGTWSAEAGPGDASDVETGSFAFGPLGVTRALCPPPSMDEKIARDAEYIRGYHLRGDTLSLSLMADGGIYRWVALAD